MDWLINLNPNFYIIFESLITKTKKAMYKQHTIIFRPNFIIVIFCSLFDNSALNHIFLFFPNHISSNSKPSVWNNPLYISFNISDKFSYWADNDNPIPIWWPIYCVSLIFYLEDFLGYLKILNLQVNLIMSRSHFGLKSKEFVMSFNAES